MKKQRLRALAWPCSALLLALLLTLAILGSVYLARHHNKPSNKQSQLQGQETGTPTTPDTSTTPLPPNAVSSNWDQVAKLPQYTNKHLVAFLSPLVQISSNMYGLSQTAVSGWKLSPLVNPLAPSSGATASVYVEDTASPPRLVVAFRGTSTRQDMCVDRLLFGDLPVVQLPSTSYCLSTYTNKSLDYVSQGVSYTRKALEAYPGASVVLTGHSLGGGLAILVSASLSTKDVIIPVVAFSSPGTKDTLKSMSLELSPEQKKRTVVVGDEWDSVVAAFPQVGTVCLVQHKPPAGCDDCPAKFTSSNCANCALEAHRLDLIIDNLQKGAKFACSNE